MKNSDTNNMNSMYTDVGDLLLRKGTSDKNTTHKYGIAYNLIFNSQYLKANKSIRVLEIGVSMFGEGSVEVFSSIPFVDKYVGIDINEYKGKFKGKNVTLYAGPKYDAYSDEMLDFLENNEEKFDIIIDDGPHTWKTQEWFLRKYNRLLSAGGVLVCEDISGKNSEQLQSLQRELNLYILDLRLTKNQYNNDIIALRYV